jgi:FSR family fosmidomycin resistance protein-like MFS transporter
MSLLKDKIFSSLAWSHFIVDVMNSQRSILLTYFSGPFGLSNTTLGGINTLYAFSGSLAQPVFGYLADRFGPRWVITGGVFWMAGFFTLAVTIPGPIALIFLVLASLGSGAFHPAGSLSATLRGQTHMAGKQTTAASWFFFFGQFAFFLGPILGGRVIDSVGPSGLVVAALVGVILGSGWAGDPFTVEFTTSGCHRPGFRGGFTGLDAAGDDGFPAEIPARPGV